jgi:hypothetical protein
MVIGSRVTGGLQGGLHGQRHGAYRNDDFVAEDFRLQREPNKVHEKGQPDCLGQGEQN